MFFQREVMHLFLEETFYVSCGQNFWKAPVRNYASVNCWLRAYNFKNKLLHGYFLRILSRDFIHRYPLKFTISDNILQEKDDFGFVNSKYIKELRLMMYTL